MPADPNANRHPDRITILEAKGPNNPTVEELTWRLVEGTQHERFTMLEPADPVNLTDEQKCWRAAEVTQRERFTMLEPSEPTKLAETQKALPAAEPSEEQFVADDLALLQGLINRVGAARLHQLIDQLTAEPPQV
jgi:hypothetical protein